VASVPEGDDKPRKYPSTFARASAVVLNKVDLLPVTDFSMSAFADGLRATSAAPLFPLSVRTGEGLRSWLAWVEALRGVASPPVA
jgi:hydrogenase nickel incorporation protein HypB